jgi:hypothetical protein
MIPGIETLIGGALGGLFRLSTAWLETREKQRDREHEYKMTELHGAQAERAAEFRMRELGVRTDLAVTQLDAQALIEGVKAQVSEARSAGGIAATLSATVRPIVTYLLVLLYMGHKMVEVAIAASGGATMLDALAGAYGEADMAIFSSILAFWFVDRAMRQGFVSATPR